MRLLFLLAVLFMACVPRTRIIAPDKTVTTYTLNIKPVYDFCATKCGMTAYVADCAGLAEMEVRARYALSKYVPAFTMEKSCKAVKGWHVNVVPGADPKDGGWMDADMGSLLGLCVSHHKQLVVGTEDWVMSALAHEIAHVLDHEILNALTKDKPGHWRWRTRGICPAIKTVSTAGDEKCDKYD